MMKCDCGCGMELDIACVWDAGETIQYTNTDTMHRYIALYGVPIRFRFVQVTELSPTSGTGG